ncbi:hypothetical protein MY4038_002386 [Beauveria bassiana]
MCYQVVELYAACRCLYYQHAVDRCPSYGHHGVEKRTIWVGYSCAAHAAHQAAAANHFTHSSDSGYSSYRSASKGFR